jgi:hypothetical protein
MERFGFVEATGVTRCSERNFSPAPYAGAGSRQVNTRLLEPLRSRYTQLVRELGDDGYPASFTEILHALLDDGPATADEAREVTAASPARGYSTLSSPRVREATEGASSIRPEARQL